MFGTGFSALGPNWREEHEEALLRANISLVQDENGFIYHLVLRAEQDVDAEVKSNHGYNNTELKLVCNIQNLGQFTNFGLYHVDQNWKDRVMGRLYLVESVRDYSRKQTGIEVVPVKDGSKTLIFEGSLPEANKARECYERDLFLRGPCFLYGYHYRWEITKILPPHPKE